MSQSDKQSLRKLFNKSEWWDILSAFTNVLNINLFIVDADGLVILPPVDEKYGGMFFSDRQLGFDLHFNQNAFLNHYRYHRSFLTARHPYQLFSFALPISHHRYGVVGYMVVGPLILNQPLSSAQYQNESVKRKANYSRVLTHIRAIRTMATPMLESILELLREILRERMYFSTSSHLDEQGHNTASIMSSEMQKLANDIIATVNADELLVTMLDVALTMTAAECGSIMLMDQAKDSLIIKASRGLNENIVSSLGDIDIDNTISGWAVKHRKKLVLTYDSEKHTDIKRLMCRQEIQRALVMPLTRNQESYGVLNLHTKKKDDQIEANVDNLNDLAQLLACALPDTF